MDRTGELNPNYKHGGKGTRLYGIWKDMRKRCYNVSAKNYKYYGGKGIKICPEWQDFSAFKLWSELNGYSESLTIDRIRSTGNYEPENCRWATILTQRRNQSNNRFVNYKGERLTISQAALLSGNSAGTIIWRLNKGWDTEKAISFIATIGNTKQKRNGRL